MVELVLNGGLRIHKGDYCILKTPKEKYQDLVDKEVS
jgi:hypothetical protein